MAEPVPSAASSAFFAGLHPADIANAYGLSGGVDGLTVGVVIADDTPTLESDLAHFRSAFGLPPCTTANGCFHKYDENGGTSYPATNTGWSIESSLDVQAVSAACPACRITVVEAADTGMEALGTAVNTAVRLGVAAVSMSWGAPENQNASSYAGRYFNHPGVPLVAATGDTGYPQADMPATFPTVIAVGGTTLSRTAAASSQGSASDAITVINGHLAPFTGLTASEEHLAALMQARAELARARTRADSAVEEVASARSALTDRKKRLAAAGSQRQAAALLAKHTNSAGARRALGSAKAFRKAALQNYRRARTQYTIRDRALASINTSVRSLRSAVAAAEAVVAADRSLSSAPITVIAPVHSVPLEPTPSSPVVLSGPANLAPTPTAIDTPPTASFTASQSALSTTFDATGSAARDGSISDYSWRFGDGSSGTGRTATHMYAAAGTYTANLTVTDGKGATATASVLVTATAPVSAARGGWTETAWSDSGSGCSTQFNKPKWQTDDACTTRTVADISADADPATGLAIYDTFGTIGAGYTSDGWLLVGGTSLATPLIAGMIVRSGHAGTYTDAGPLYERRSGFWDIISGSNGSCSGSTVCTAGNGYDGPTGLGTPKSLSSF